MRFLSTMFFISLLLLACDKDDDNTNSIPQSSPGSPLNSFVDSRDSNVYTYVKIGTQVWMAENLKYLPEVVGVDSGSKSSPLYYVYDYNGYSVIEAKKKLSYNTFGVFYNFSAATIGNQNNSEITARVKGICPDGWHLPSDEEWTQLTDYLGGRPFAGGKLKVNDTTYWRSPNIGATNETSFSALGSGYRASDGTFLDLKINGFWWSSTADGQLSAWFRNMNYNYGDVYRTTFFKDAGFCVRCIQD